MTVNDILTLAKAGYNAKQIELMATRQMPQTVQQTIPQTIPQTVQQIPQGVVQQIPQGVVQQNPQAVNDLIAELRNLSGTIQASNIAGTQVSTIKRETADDILANFIAPLQNPINQGGVK